MLLNTQLLEQLDALCLRAPKLTTLTQLQQFLSAYAVRIPQEPKESIRAAAKAAEQLSNSSTLV